MSKLTYTSSNSASAILHLIQFEQYIILVLGNQIPSELSQALHQPNNWQNSGDQTSESEECGFDCLHLLVYAHQEKYRVEDLKGGMT